MKIKLGTIVKVAVKYGPIIYPIVKKMMDNKSVTKPSIHRTK